MDFTIFVNRNPKSMTTRDPFSEFFEKVTSFVPAEVNRMKPGDFGETLEEAYVQFEEYFLSSLPFSFDIDEYREEEGTQDACSVPIPVSQFADTLSQAAELLRTIGKNPAVVSPRFPVQSSKETGALGYLNERVSIGDLPYDALSRRQQEAVNACQELMNSTSHLIETIMNLIKGIDEELDEPLQETLIGGDRGGLELNTALPPVDPVSPIPFFFVDTNYAEDELRSICSALKEWNWLDEDTAEEDFVFYFIGKGGVPSQHLLWSDNNVRLSLLLSILTQDRAVWKKASRIFKIKNKAYDWADSDSRVDEYLPVKANTLRVTYSYTVGSDKYLKKLDEVKRVIGLN